MRRLLFFPFLFVLFLGATGFISESELIGKWSSSITVLQWSGEFVIEFKKDGTFQAAYNIDNAASKFVRDMYSTKTHKGTWFLTTKDGSWWPFKEKDKLVLEFTEGDMKGQAETCQVKIMKEGGKTLLYAAPYGDIAKTVSGEPLLLSGTIYTRVN